MEKEIILSKRFKNSSNSIYNYLLDAFSAKTAYEFLEKLEHRMIIVAQNPEIGSLSGKKKGVRSVKLHPHNRIYFRQQHNQIYFLDIIDMRINPTRNPY